MIMKGRGVEFRNTEHKAPYPTQKWFTSCIVLQYVVSINLLLVHILIGDRNGGMSKYQREMRVITVLTTCWMRAWFVAFMQEPRG